MRARWFGPIAALALAACAGAITPASGPAGACAGPDRRVVVGACVSAATAAQICGPAAAPAEGGCAPRPCGTGGYVDLGTGVCGGPGALRGAAEVMQIPLVSGETLGCPSPFTLVWVGNGASCVAPEATCGAGARWDGHRCAPLAACPLGQVPAERGCARVAAGGVTDVGAWARVAIGPDGGVGSSFVCGPLLGPEVLASGTDRTLRMMFGVDLVLPDNDPTMAYARVSGESLDTGEPLPAEIVARAAAAIGRLLEALRAAGQTASAAAVSTRVRCTVPLGPRPIPVSVGPG